MAGQSRTSVLSGGEPASQPAIADVANETKSDSKVEGLLLFDSLWMSLYLRLGDLCVDIRPAVRKSAGQTLFSMVAAHGSLLTSAAWQNIVWKVIFLLSFIVLVYCGVSWQHW